MKLQIESELQTYYYSPNTEIYRQFALLIKEISKSTCESDLKNIDQALFTEFKIGFGANHMWVKQIFDNLLQDKRLIFVEFISEEKKNKAIEYINEHYSNKTIFFTEEPFPKNHLYCIRKADFEFVEHQNFIDVYLHND